MTAETQTVRIEFTPTMDSEKILRRRYTITLDASAPMTDFVDRAEEMLYESYPDAEILDTL